MGNQQSQSSLGLDSTAPSALTPEVQRRLSKSPFIKSLLESASRPSNSPRNMPSLTSSWYEVSSPLYAPPRRTSIQTLSHNQLVSSSHKSKHEMINQPTTTMTTTRGPNGQYYVVSTTTYYVKSPTSRASSSTSGSQTKDDGQRHSQASSSDGSSFQSDIDLPRSQDEDGERTYSNGFQFTTINGRRYVSVPGTRLRLACDDDECDRLIILHFLLKYAFNSNFTAPVKNLLSLKQMKTVDQKRPKVLDIGCGSGTWLLEMATEYPNSDFYGVDICHMYPDAIKPVNARFKQCNVLDGLPFQDNKFDYVHIRLMLSSLTERQAVSLLQEVARVLKPGGIVEICDVEYRIQRPGPVGETLINHRLRDTYAEMFDIKLDLAHHLSTLLMMVSQGATNGFVDIHQRCTTIPLGWGGKFGEVHAQTLEDFLLSLDPRVREMTKTTQQLSNWTPAGMESKATMLTDAAVKHIVNECSKYQSHLNWYVCYGRKPFATFRNASEPPTPLLTSPLDTTSTTLEASAWESINNFAAGYVD